MADIAGSSPAPTSGGAPSAPAPKPAASSGAAPSAGTPNTPSTPSTQTPAGGPAPRTLKSQLPTEAAAPKDVPDAKAEKPEPWKRKFKLKVDGQELEEEYDEDRLTVELQKSRAADKRFRAAAERTKQIEAALSRVKEDPASFLREVAGLDPYQFAEQLMAAKFNEDLMPEEQRERMKLQKELESYKAREQAAEEAKKTAAKQQFEKQVFEEVERETLEALDELGYEDKNFVRSTLMPMMADLQIANLQHGIELTPKQLATEVNRRLETIHRKQITSLKGDRLLQYLGEDVVKEAIRARLEKQRGAPPVPPPAPAPAPKVEQKPRPKGDFFTRHVLGAE